MPTPRPIIAASCGPKVGTTNGWLRTATMAKPMPMPNRAVRIGRPMAITEPKATSRMMIAAPMPISSLGPSCGWTTLAMGCPPSSICKASLPRRLGRVDHRLHGRLVEVDGLLVELHPGEADARVDAADLRVGLVVGADHTRHVWQRAHLVDQRGDVGLRRRRAQRFVGPEHDVGRVAGGLREAGGEEVLRARRFRVAAAEAVLVVGADDAGDDAHHDERPEPDEQDPPAVVVAPAGEPGEHPVAPDRRGRDRTVELMGGRIHHR